MKITTPRLFPNWITAASVLLIFICCTDVISQTAPQTKKTTSTPKLSADKLAIDSLKQVIENLRVNLKKTDSLHKEEKFVSADLRDQLLKLDDYRKKLEDNNQSFKGQNLKLNQSNRILIIFNSLVAVLLVITLVFFLKRLTKRKTPDTETNEPVELKVTNEASQTTRFASFEDRLMQLERLGKLREKGLLSEAEFVAEKQKVLGK